jgi:signal transduction histidine kinase
MNLGSLRLRLLVGATVGIVLALAAAGYFIVQNFSATLERDRLSDLLATVTRLIAEINPDAEEALTLDDFPADPRYATPLSGVYWQVQDLSRGKTYRSRSLWDTELTPDSTRARNPEPSIEFAEGPQGIPLIMVSRFVHVEDSTGATRDFLVSVAEVREEPGHAVERFASDLIVALILLGLFLLVAAWLQVQLGLMPLRKLKRDVEEIRSGARDRLPENYAGELQPVTQALNHLLGAQEASVAFARHRAADLAHGLKTPLAVLSATAERLRAAGDRENADVVDLLGTELSDRIDYQLRLSRLRIRAPSKGVRSSLNSAVLRSVSVLRKTERGESINWGVDLAQDIEVDLDGHDLMELVGVLLENANKWAVARIDVAARKVEKTAELQVSDDGHGLTDEQIKALGERGKRLDQSVPGEGLGLAIVFEIVRLNGGVIALGRSPLGGLEAKVQLPLA